MELTAFLIHPEENPVLMDAIEHLVQHMLTADRVNGTVSWYYDESSYDFVEYGIRVTVRGMSRELYAAYLVSIRTRLCEFYGHIIRVEFP